MSRPATLALRPKFGIKGRFSAVAICNRYTHNGACRASVDKRADSIAADADLQPPTKQSLPVTKEVGTGPPRVGESGAGRSAGEGIAQITSPADRFPDIYFYSRLADPRAR